MFGAAVGRYDLFAQAAVRQARMINPRLDCKRIGVRNRPGCHGKKAPEADCARQAPADFAAKFRKPRLL
jgi:hypothetical protein